MKHFFAEEKINLERQREFDYAKVIAIVFMVLIHVWEELSYFDCLGTAPTGFWHNLLQFGAGPLAAPLFMFAMGVGICYSGQRGVELCNRTFLLCRKLLLPAFAVVRLSGCRNYFCKIFTSHYR